MDLHVYFAYFFGGIFLGNAIPHLVNGISGRKFPTPFANSFGNGPSSSMANVLWAFANLTASYFLIFHVWFFNPYSLRDVGMVGLGFLFISVRLSQSFEKLDQGS